MKNKTLVIITWFLFIVLVYTRLAVRDLNPLWIDEINEISHLRSFSYLLYEYLPSIPGGVFSHYIIILPINMLFPGNKFMLSLPGFISCLLVFILIPKTISSFHITSKKETEIASFFARLAFVFDPRLTYQAIEIRPYSLLPLLWIISVILISKIISFDRQSAKMKNIILLSLVTMFLWLWHIYGFIMSIFIYLFFILKSKIDKNILKHHRKSLVIILISLLSFIPIWIYFTRGSTNSNLNTFEFLEKYVRFINTVLNQGYIKGITWQNYFYLLMIFSFFCLVFFNTIYKVSRYLHYFYKMLFFLVIAPIVVIFLLDFIGEYWFLYRQFAWVNLPFYIAIGILFSGLFKKRKIA